MATQNKPLLPYRVANDSIEELKGFISTILYARDIDTRTAILDCLFNKDPIIKGPFIDLKLPFRTTEETWPLIESLKPKWPSYLHQMKSYQNLKHQSSKNTLITTGTGSGKSECFILPILDYIVACKKKGNVKGVKALIMYPMNALIEDQGERLSELANELNKNLPADQKIRIGRYTGNHGNTKEHEPENPKIIIDHRETLCEDPPDVLLTNYRMLDFMLIRNEEQNFWNKDTQNIFKYLVLDELHTFDGAQGADVACLLRRLRLKINVDFTCVGTSATVGDGSRDAVIELCTFAETLFGSKFEPTSVIGEDRIKAEEILKPVDKNIKLPKTKSSNIDLLVAGKNQYDKYIEELISNWGAPRSQTVLGDWLLTHPLFHKIFKALKTGDTIQELASQLDVETSILGEFLDLLSYARQNNGKFAVFPISSQLWIQSVPYLLRKLDQPPSFIRSQNQSEIVNHDHLPAINCNECGASGWLTVATKNTESSNFTIELKPDKILASFYGRKDATYLFPKLPQQNANYEVMHICPSHRLLSRDIVEGAETFEMTVIPQSEDKGENLGLTGSGRCPSCESLNSMRLSSFSESMLTSVLTNVFLATGSNPSDKKYLIFNDSVQDTAHQAGYLSARGFRFNFRRFLLKQIDQTKHASTLNELLGNVALQIKTLWEESKKSSGKEAKQDLLQILPKDLWDRWKSVTTENPLSNPKNLDELIERMNWEAWFEMTTFSELGWSLRKTTLVALEPQKSLFDHWVTAIENFKNRTADYSRLSDVESFTYGLLRRIVTQGSIYRAELESCYQSTSFNYWTLQNSKPHLASLFFPRSPKLLSFNQRSVNPGRRKPPVYFLGNISSTSWYSKWAQKHGLTSSAATNFYSELLNILSLHPLGIKKVAPEKHEDLLALDNNLLEVHWKQTKLMRCDSCNHLAAVAITVQKLKCTQMHCEGHLKENSLEVEKTEQEAYLNYMGKQYQRAIISPLAHPHTGQLQNDKRKNIEQAFKRNLLPGDSLQESGQGKPYFKDHPINVLTCTPTMEMGIDIGTLSGVILRSFPRTLSNARQRLGRSGRSSGNSFNTIVTSQRPHDLQYWNNTKMFFEGTITPPGCEFRNKQLLIRQFNAYCFDVFSYTNPEIVLPRSFEDLSGNFEEHIYFVNFFKFLEIDAINLIKPFLDAIDLGSHTDFGKEEMIPFFAESLKKQDLKKAIISELKIIKKNKNQASQEEATANKAEKNLDKEASENLNGSELIEKAEEIKKKKNFSAYIKRQLGSSEYLLKILGDKGFLPNYAFPEEGVRLDYSVRFPANPNAVMPKNKFRFKQDTISRSSVQALREFAPGSHYYVVGFKVPITRLETNFQKGVISSYLTCNSCGTMTLQGTNTNLKADTCPNCEEQDQPIINVLDFKSATSAADFQNSQILDQEEQREKPRIQIETFINYQKTGNNLSKSATWVSPESLLAFEFKTNAEIFHLNRNLQPKQQEPLYHKVCKECLAVPSKFEESIPIFKSSDGTNRHAFNCLQKNAANPELIELSLGRKITSDSVRFLADDNTSAPSIVAALSLAMKVYLKGSPQHINIESSQLKVQDGGYRNIITLYDNVPGGTGHLRSLMQFKDEDLDSSISGLSKISKVFKETYDKLEVCNCTSGCYECLLNYDNQYDHKNIDKEKSKRWLKRFFNAQDWESRQHSLSYEVVNGSIFDSAAEELFAEIFRSKPLPIPDIDLVIESSDHGNLNFELKSFKKLKDSVNLSYTSKTEVPLSGAIKYTKPDYILSNKIGAIGYIYIDGVKFHLNPDSKISTFEAKDLQLRSDLRNLYKKPVLTFSYDMVKAWGDSKRNNVNISRTSTPANISLIPHLIALLFGKKNENFNQSEFDELWKILIPSFCAFEFMKACEIQTDGILNKQDKKLLQSLLETINADSIFGGLGFNSKTKIFEMDASESKRLNNFGEIDSTFKKSWELFWMLWTIDSDLVALKSSESKNSAA